MNEIHFKEDSRTLLLEGINKLCDAVSTTFGPNGSTVIIPNNETYGTYKVTKDGVSVANAVKFHNPVMNVGAQLVKQAAQKTVDDAGDGTTTSTILSAAFINHLQGFTPKEIKEVLDDLIPKTIKRLKDNSRSLDYKDIKHVATISANNDTLVGDIIQKAYDFSNIVKVEESNLTEDDIQCIDGMMLNTTYFHKDFINTKKGTCELQEPHVLILDGKLEKLDSFKYVLEDCASNNKPLVIITEHIHEQVLFKLRTFVLNQQLQVCVIKSPGFGPHRKDLLNDLAAFTKGQVITDMNTSYKSTILGKLKSISVGSNSSILTKDDSVNIDILVQDLKIHSENKDLETYDKDLLQQRIEYLTGKISIIKVGGKTENEMKEKFDRYDDAVKAVSCALEEGIVEGGGVALVKTIPPSEKYSDIEQAFYKSISSPFLTITEYRKGHIDITRSMFDQNIIDPLKVTRCALENAASVAKTILSTEVIVLSETEWKN